eukprot:5171299-Prorocentrum_lima.AAC.1
MLRRRTTWSSLCGDGGEGSKGHVLYSLRGQPSLGSQCERPDQHHRQSVPSLLSLLSSPPCKQQ